MRIQNNPTAFNVWSSYTSNSNGLRNSMNRLSTGLIRNVDDPAGIGISERMRAQIKGTSMARSNTENAVSMVQTADAWMQKMGDMLSRMKSLAIESGGIMSSTDKSNVQSEFKAMQEEIVRITSFHSAAAKFNGLYLFRGGDGTLKVDDDEVNDVSAKLEVQIGADINQKVKLSLSNLSLTNTNSIGSVHSYKYDSTNTAIAASETHDSVQWASVIDVTKFSVGSANAVGKIDVAIDFLANARAKAAAQQKRLEYTGEGLLTYEDNLRSAESKIRDVDMARESSEFTKYQIMTNAANAMLAQANGLPQSVLQLLG